MLIYLARGQLPWQSLWHEDGDVRKNNGYKFSLATIFRLAINLIEIYKNVHKCGILHR